MSYTSQLLAALAIAYTNIQNIQIVMTFKGFKGFKGLDLIGFDLIGLLPPIAYWIQRIGLNWIIASNSLLDSKDSKDSNDWVGLDLYWIGLDWIGLDYSLQ